MKATIKFLPVICLALLMMMGFDCLLAAPIACIIAIIIAKATDKVTFAQCQEAALDSVKNILVALFILMFAYAMASAFMATGVGASIINIALDLGISARLIPVVALFCTGILSVATGTSWGTFAACAPIFLWLGYIVGTAAGDVSDVFILTLCASAGGACFGDNIGLISDTTIVSSGIHGVDVPDRVRTQGVWSILCLILAGVVFYVVGLASGVAGNSLTAEQIQSAMDTNISDEVILFLNDEKPAAIDLLGQVQGQDISIDDAGNVVREVGIKAAWWMCIPLIIVVGLAIAGLNTFVCIGSGIVFAYIFGCIAGTCEFSISFGEVSALLPSMEGGLVDFLGDNVTAGFADAGSWVVVMMMWIAAFGGVMRLMDAFGPLKHLVAKISGSVKTLMFWNGVLCLFGNAVLADEMAQIVTIGPIIKEITEDNIEGTEEGMYNLAKRNATFNDAMGVFGSQLIPWHVYLSFYVGIAVGVFPIVGEKGNAVTGDALSPMDFVGHNYMAMIAVFSMLLLTVTGTDKFIPLFRLAREPEVQLKKNAA